MSATILFDVDGVLADFTGRVLDVVHEETGRAHTPDDHTKWSFREALGLPARHWRAVARRIGEPGFACSLRPYPGAVELVKRVAEQHEVFFVTADWRSSPTWVHDRNAWLERHFGRTLGSRVVHTSHKVLVDGDVLVEDKVETVEAWERAGQGRRRAFIVDRPYNRQPCAHGQRIKQLEELWAHLGGGA